MTTETSADFLKRAGTNAQLWAQEFIRIVREKPFTIDPLDEGFLIGWFANAIEAGRSTSYFRGYEDGVKDYKIWLATTGEYKDEEMS